MTHPLRIRHRNVYPLSVDEWTSFNPRHPLVAPILEQIMAEQDEALKRFDLDPNPANRAELLTVDGIEREVGIRALRLRRRSAALRAEPPVARRLRASPGPR